MNLAEGINATVMVLSAFLASSGFWALLRSKTDNKSATTKLIMGLAHDKIITLGMVYLQRGCIKKDELDDFEKYLYSPYKELGGNGIAERVYNDIQKLPLDTEYLERHNGAI